jgi:hypothetical protein
LAHEVSIYNTPSVPHAASTDTPNYCEGIAILDDYNKPEVVGKPITEYWAKTTSTAFNRCIPKEEKEKFDKEYLPPANVPYVKPPKLPQYAWSRMQRYDRMADSRLQSTQQAASAPIIPLLRAIESVNVPGEVDKKQVLSHLTAALALVGETSNKVSIQRKNMLRVLFNPDYKKLADKSVTSCLLGDKFDADVKEIRRASSQSLMKSSDSSSSHSRSRPEVHRRQDVFVKPQSRQDNFVKPQSRPAAPPQRGYGNKKVFRGNRYNFRKH